MSDRNAVAAAESFWRRAFDADFLVQEGVIDPEDRQLLCYAETPRQILDTIVRWYEHAKLPLLPRRADAPA